MTMKDVQKYKEARSELKSTEKILILQRKMSREGSIRAKEGKELHCVDCWKEEEVRLQCAFKEFSSG